MATAGLDRRCIHRLVWAQAAVDGFRIALVVGRDQVSYRELVASAEALAGALQAVGVGPGTPVGLALERSSELAVAVLGTLAAGGACLLLDPTWPAARTCLVLADAGCQVVLAHRSREPSLSAADATIIYAEDEWPVARAARHDLRGWSPAVSGDSLAYLVYTSGSTGHPKGVQLPHRSFARGRRWAPEAYRLTSSDRYLMMSPRAPEELLWPLFVGGTVVIAPPGAEYDPAATLDLIAHHMVTAISLTPSLLRVLADRPAFTSCRALRQIFCAGEILTSELLELVAARTRAPVRNVYGLAEAPFATIWTGDLGCSERVAPVGRPLDMDVRVVDESGRTVATGVEGEVTIAGEGVALGYLGRPELTAARFVPEVAAVGHEVVRFHTGDRGRWRSDGSLELCGRFDDQLKIAGFRIETGEVEAVVRRLPGVRDAAVIAVGTNSDQRHLVAFVELREGHSPPPSTAELRSLAASLLPAAAVPRRISPVAALPRTSSGKLDRRALKTAVPMAPIELSSEPPRGELETVVARELAAVLGRSRIGRHDDLFALGGSSLAALRLNNALRHRLGVDLPIAVVFERPTVVQLAQWLAAATDSTGIGLRNDSAEAAAVPHPLPRRSRAYRPGLSNLASRMLARLALAAAACACALLAAEGAARVLLPSWAPVTGDRRFWRHDVLLGWDHVPGQTGRFRHPEFDVAVRINDHGERDRSYAYQRTPGQRRILVLGDSFGWGFGVEQPEIFTELIEERWPAVEIVNASVSGYGTDQELLLYRTRGARYRPDVVLLLFSPNDVTNNGASEQYWHFKPHFRLADGRLQLAGQPVARPTLRQRADQLLIDHTWVVRRLWLRAWWAGRQIGLAAPLERGDTGAARAVTAELLRTLAHEVRAAGGRLVLVDAAQRMPSLDRFLAATANAADIPFLPLDAVLSRAGPRVTFATDSHWSPLGHRVAAHAIDRFLVELDLLGAPGT